MVVNKCSHCGKELPENAKFCGHCGNEIIYDSDKGQIANEQKISVGDENMPKHEKNPFGSLGKHKTKIIIGSLVAFVLLIIIFNSNNYYNKDHFLFYSSPISYGNGSNGIVLTSQNWKIIPNNGSSDIILWKATFKNNSKMARKLSVWANFKDESFMEITSDFSNDSGNVLSPEENRTFNGKVTISKKLSRRIKFMDTAISSQYQTTNTGYFGSYQTWESDKL